MPTSVAIAAFAATSISYTAVAGLAFSFSWSAFASSLVMSGLSAALRPDAPSSQPSSITSSARTVTTRQAISPWRGIYGRTRVGGVTTYKKVGGVHSFYYVVITLAGHVCEEIEEIYFNDELVPLDGSGNATGRYADHVTIIKSLGDETGQPFPDLVTASGGEWTDAHRQTGHTKIYVVLAANNDLFPAGVPNITAVVKGKNDIYDPRTGLTGWSDNPALCVANYLCDSVRGVGAVYADAINETELIAAANICDETVTLADTTTEKRYTCNGSITTAEKPVDIIPKLASAMAGYVTKIGATWNIHAGAYDTPTITLTQTDLAGAIGWQSLVSRRESCNGVKGIYVEPGNLWQPADFPAVVSDTAVAEDGGEAIWHDLRLEMTDSGTMAQRIAKIDLLRTRQPLTVSFPGKLSAFRAQPGKTVFLTIEKYGWDAKPFWVAGGSFAINADGTLGYHLSLRETAAEIYDWSTDEEQAIDLAPNTSLPDAFDITAPGTPAISEMLFETTGSAGVKARATITWTASPDAFVLDYFPEYRVTAGAWVTVAPTPGLTADINDIAPGIYEFRVRARSKFGVFSDYSIATTREVYGLSAVPADLSGFTIIKSAGFALAAWTLSTDLDVRIGGRAVVRHSPLTSGATWEDGIIVEEFNGDAITGLVPLMTGTYLLKARDSSNNYSTNAVSFVATEGMVSGFTTVATSTQEPTFSGTKTDTTVVSGALELDSATSGSYAFAAAVDLTTVATRRFEADIAATSFAITDMFDSRTELMDDWGMFDGGAIDDCDATLYVAITDDDPAGSPTWSAWMPFFVGDFTCRAAKFKLDLIAGDATHNISISTLAVDIKVPT
jgi:hypothetical protein